MIPLDDQIAEVAREIALRRNVYPTFIARGRFTQQEADRHSERMAGVLRTLEWVHENEAMIRQFAAERRDHRQWKHPKSGHVVTEVARGFAQVSVHPIEEMTAVTIYRHNGRWWVRNAVEFDDGRFVATLGGMNGDVSGSAGDGSATDRTRGHGIVGGGIPEGAGVESPRDR